VHKADPRDSRPPSRHRDRRHSPPAGGPPGSCLLQQPDPEPRDLTPHRTRVTIREIPQRPSRRPPGRTGLWIGGYRVHVLDVAAAVFGIVLLVAILVR
jgi:hypothetical protein